jgi:hypothetical protein
MDGMISKLSLVDNYISPIKTKLQLTEFQLDKKIKIIKK